ncbi:hypothetical protein HELRODRAFT_167133 [Helobdella robusta]|uniref:Ionotropic glutamate receptor L-glutamate and glycine-binding domain-containing protein n=1 Tax=Helobdella robusta TaxID=6412 RepID=T1EZ24_HELRO|nr:hypothetical protein HELRODRAFT_167133 [Helobdella robusta]ESO10626.1 hypothetical protein HELRODRAFT_167133 [Helobdella robusta]
MHYLNRKFKKIQPQLVATTTSYNQNLPQPQLATTTTCYNHNLLQPQHTTTTTCYKHNRLQPQFATTTTYHNLPQPQPATTTTYHKRHKEPPYCSEKDGNLEGFIPDLMKAIEEKTQMSFHLSKVEDGKFGSKNDRDAWDGMIGKVISSDASIAAGPITVTDERKEAVDFTVPFMSVDLSLIMLKQEDGAKKISSAKDLLNQTDLKIGVLKDGSTHSFFRQTKDTTFMKIYEAMIKDETNFVPSYQAGVEKIHKTTTSPKYAMIIESATADYYTVQKPCDLLSVKIINDTRNYALAVAKNWPQKEQLNKSIEELKKDGKLKELKTKWWPSACNGVSKTGAVGGATVFITLGAIFLSLMKSF